MGDVVACSSERDTLELVAALVIGDAHEHALAGEARERGGVAADAPYRMAAG